MGETQGVTILSRRFPAKRAILTAAARGDLHIVWPREYRLVWRLKRLFPSWFVRRVAQLRRRQLARANPPPG